MQAGARKKRSCVILKLKDTNVQIYQLCQKYITCGVKDILSFGTHWSLLTFTGVEKERKGNPCNHNTWRWSQGSGRDSRRQTAMTELLVRAISDPLGLHLIPRSPLSRPESTWGFYMTPFETKLRQHCSPGRVVRTLWILRRQYTLLLTQCILGFENPARK